MDLTSQTATQPAQKQNKLIPILLTPSHSSDGVVAITSASHTEGPRFDPRFEHGQMNTSYSMVPQGLLGCYLKSFWEFIFLASTFNIHIHLEVTSLLVFLALCYPTTRQETIAWEGPAICIHIVSFLFPLPWSDLLILAAYPSDNVTAPPGRHYRPIDTLASPGT